MAEPKQLINELINKQLDDGAGEIVTKSMPIYELVIDAHTHEKSGP